MFLRYGCIVFQAGKRLAISKTQNLGTESTSNLSTDDYDTVVPEKAIGPRGRTEQISRAMKLYLDEVAIKEQFFTQQTNIFKLGKRHLANIMGIDKDSMTQEDIDSAINYLFPSGLTEKRARPIMRHPQELWSNVKKAQFDISGRPFDSLFYTNRPNFYEFLSVIVEINLLLMYVITLLNITRKTSSLNDYEDTKLNQGRQPPKESQLMLIGSTWLSLDEFANLFDEKITDEMYSQLIAALEHLITLPFAHNERDFIFEYRKDIGTAHQSKQFVPLVELDPNTNRRMAKAIGTRKRTEAYVTLYANGSGKCTVDGHDIDEFRSLNDREMLLAPFVVLDLLGQFDVEARTKGRDVNKAIPAAVRHGISICLCAFTDDQQQAIMKLAGLLTRDPRRGERRKINQPGARAKWIWKKR